MNVIIWLTKVVCVVLSVYDLVPLYLFIFWPCEEI